MQSVYNKIYFAQLLIDSILVDVFPLILVYTTNEQVNAINEQCGN